MSRIAHLSDLHFGSTDPAQLEALAGILASDGIEAIVVSGDITQSGRKHEFADAARWFEALDMDVMVVPGNHDTPVYNLASRFLKPWSRYERIAGFAEEPIEERDSFVFAGLNSARRIRPSLDWSTGKLSRRQLDAIGAAYAEAEGRLRICSFHHPILGFEDGGSAGRAVLPKADEVMRTLTDAKVDVVMTGHVHKARITVVEEDGWSFILSQAGTAVSTRLRGEAASYNVLTQEGEDRLRLSTHRWGEGGFAKEVAHRFERTKAGWQEVSS
ncbi:metallophosphoesterase family protein [Parvularcula maris]|uniref:Metallophosphoesterase n=1 Tax=Parvularcula maris TaxID=2965077 RepID=A0A9X2L941_9PROT|nr:metallophosphoesterase [Parvularcula maris]MCQ8185390.1 metallophosphoesterase [Parvularcula maris]